MCGKLLLSILFFVSAVSATVYNFTSDNRCLLTGISQHLTSTKLLNARQCAIECVSMTSCAMLMVVPQNGTCGLYKALNNTNYSAVTYPATGLRRVGLLQVNYY